MYLNNFESQKRAIGTSVITPNACTITDNSKVLYIPKLSIAAATIIKEDTFINFQKTGVYLLLTTGELIASDSAQLKDSYEASEVTGIVVISANTSLLFGIDQPKQVYFCGANKSCSAYTFYKGDHAARASADYDGKSRTDILKEVLTQEPSWAVNSAYNTKLNDQNCWLPSLGELKDILSQKPTIIQLLAKCGKTWTLDNFGEIWSSSLQEKEENSKVIQTVYGYYWSTSQYDGFNCQGLYYVLPVTSYTL